MEDFGLEEFHSSHDRPNDKIHQEALTLVSFYGYANAAPRPRAYIGLFKQLSYNTDSPFSIVLNAVVPLCDIRSSYSHPVHCIPNLNLRRAHPFGVL